MIRDAIAAAGIPFLAAALFLFPADGLYNNFVISPDATVPPDLEDELTRFRRAEAAATISAGAAGDGQHETPGATTPGTGQTPPETPYNAPDTPPVVDQDRMALAEMVKAVFPDDARMWQHVVWAESLYSSNPAVWECNVYGPCWSPTSDCGLLQTNAIHSWRYEALGYSMAVGCFIPEVNLQVSRQIYDARVAAELDGCYAWTTCWGY